MRPTGSAKELETRRKNALRRLRAGEQVKDVAESLGVSTQAIHYWKNLAAKGGGLNGLKAKPQHVPTSRLSDAQRNKLQRIMLQGAAKAGFPTDLWTCERVAAVVKREFDVSYHPSHLSRILHDMGFTPQKPTRRAREHDEAAADEFRKTKWASIKKGRKTTS